MRYVEYVSFWWKYKLAILYIIILVYSICALFQIIRGNFRRLCIFLVEV
nr:MAG TPA: hypothetical protein [Caudoviricetes sp.]